MTRKQLCGRILVFVVVCSLASAARAQSGEVVEWGYGPLPFRYPGNRASAVAAGYEHACAIEADTGAVRCWGSSLAANQPASVDGTAGTANAIGVGAFHSCAIQAGTGAVVCWGHNSSQQSDVPASLRGPLGSASAIGQQGQDHSCAIQADTGAAICWGASGTPQANPPPELDGTFGTASAISAGVAHSCAIQAESDAVICWGDDTHGQSSPPSSVDGTGGTATAISAGGWHTCAIRAGSGAVVCWGENDGGQASPPPSVNGSEGSATAIAAGRGHSCAIQAGAGAVICWGDGGAGGLPESLDGIHGKALAIAAGFQYNIAIQAPECSDGLENDGDGLVDFPEDPGCDDASDTRERGTAPCDNGVDDDGDALGDFPDDPGCTSVADPSERGTLVCDDGLDNDGDFLVDYTPWYATGGDRGCETPTDDSERSPALVCDDGLDNDGDGLVDYPFDANCTSTLDPSEVPIACDDGLDNDGDGLVDHGVDPGCGDANDTDEASLVLRVTKTQDTADGACDADCSLRDAVYAANANPGEDLVLIPAGTFPLAAPLDLNEPVTLRGAGARHTAIANGALNAWWLYGATGSLTLDGLSIQGGGGGIGLWFRGGSLRLDSVSIEDSSIGLFLDGPGSVAIRDSSIVRSGYAAVLGEFCVDGCSRWIGSFTLENSTVSDNAGLGLQFGSSVGPVRIAASTLAGNGSTGLHAPGALLDHVIVSGSGTQCEGPTVSLGHNIASDASCNLDQPTDRPNTAALLASLELAPNGTWTRPPAPGSPAIDGGNPAGCTDASGASLARDQRGVSRPLDGDGDDAPVCDVGAHEVAACFDGTDDDGDGLCRAADNCPSIPNLTQTDLDADGVGDDCDSCAAVANPRMSPAWLDANPWALLTGGQRDDDQDGFGNRCDADFPGTTGGNVGPADLAQFRASSGESRLGDTCGTNDARPCAIFDLDENTTAANNIGPSDLARFRALQGSPAGPKCQTCPLACEAGALRSCGP